ncbi:VanZ family protein [Paenibacillus sacheonensis]|uniref:VanZ family protein n=1 Tax=Paenibacillus sacheonensis TaxID=742054 RepID=A0A7X5BWT5_9BACL|nr:VanZ family protein [Paenibacillus sacheonensis]MBM7564031.1 glycopeptide antibiotics resistance protein [Paenibacillus sacheonensis]NBC67636.1 VanZ family protein [Paenibacillus sacheonensis]
MKNAKGFIGTLLFLLYAYLLIKIILFKFGSADLPFLWHQLQSTIVNPEYLHGHSRSVNLEPFKSIAQNLHRFSNPHDQINLIGNIAIFLPCGVFFGLLSNRGVLSFLWAAALSLAVSLGLECAQLVFAIGSFDVDDLILNVSGGLLGWVVLVLIKQAYVKPAVANKAVPH